MSAIFGLIHTSGQPVAADSLERMNSALAAHGPDGSGGWNEGHVAVGQRLMRFTPEDFFERQPLVSDDGQRVLVCDARIDNRAELAGTLGISPSEARQLPDAAFIERAYDKWGEGCTGHLIGSYTFALWNRREQRLLLVRSPMGERPLYYHSNAQHFAFSTMPKGLFALPFIPREIDLEQIADYLVVAPSEPGRTFFRGVRQLPAGHLLVVSRDGTTLRRHWQPDLKRELRLPDDNDYVEAFNELFERVIADHLRSATPVGVMMSGGLDSTAVAAIAATQLKRQGKRLATFTEVPRAGFSGAVITGRYADETPLVQAMANRYDTLDSNLIRTDGQFYLDDITPFFTAAEMPFRNASNRVWWEAILREAGRQNVRVLLTGTPGNLTISWDGQDLLPRLVRGGQLVKAWREARGLARQNASRSALRILFSQSVMPLLPHHVWRGIQRLRHRNDPIYSTTPPWRAYSPILPAFAQEQRVAERAGEKKCDFSFRPAGGNKRARFEALAELAAVTDIGAGYQALCGVETRDPTGDMRMVEFCLSLPEEQYLRDGKTRWLLQRTMANRLPAEVLNNRQRGLQAADWFERLTGAEGAIRQEMKLLEQSPLARAVLDLERMGRLVERMPAAANDAWSSMIAYRGVLERGLMTGRYLRWLES